MPGGTLNPAGRPGGAGVARAGRIRYGPRSSTPAARENVLHWRPPESVGASTHERLNHVAFAGVNTIVDSPQFGLPNRESDAEANDDELSTEVETKKDNSRTEARRA